MAPLVMIFLKAARPGTVKTRLGRDIGDLDATLIYRDLAESQIKRIPSTFELEVHYSPVGARDEMRNWLGSQRRYRVQRGATLGARLGRAFALAFLRGHERVLAIGADCPDLDEDCLQRASALLDSSDVVIGPARDGGYYLVGLREPMPRLFVDIPWSTDRVLAFTLSRAESEGKSVALLDSKEDIDDLAALNRHRRRRLKTR